MRSGEHFIERINYLRTRIPSVCPYGLPPKIREAELKMLTRLDVPKFVVHPFNLVLATEDGKSYEELFSLSGYDLVLDRVKHLNYDDLLKQLDFIKDSIT